MSPAPIQTGLFDAPTGFSRCEALSRRSDPITSYLAAGRIRASGKMRSQQNAVVSWLQNHPGEWTTAEIAQGLGIDRHDPARRMRSLERSGHVVCCPARECSVRGGLALTWGAK